MKAKLLHVDLTTRQTRSEEVSETVLRKHLGGGALAAHILLRDLPSGVDPPLNALELQPLIDYVNAVTGWNMSLYEAMKVGERNNTLARVFNVREGFTPEDDQLPQRMHESIGNGAQGPGRRPRRVHSGSADVLRDGRLGSADGAADVHEAGRARVGRSHQVAMPRWIIDISMHLENDVVSDLPGYGPKIEYVTQVTPD